MPRHYQKQLDTAFPAETDEVVIRAASQGIMIADSTIEAHPFLKSPVGRDLRGHIRRAGILYRLYDMSKSGDLPFSASMSQMPRGNWHWVELSSGRVKAHICRTDGPELFPVDSPTRQDDRHTNQLDLFREEGGVASISQLIAWLTFGVASDGTLGHLCWGIPHAEKDTWLARSNVLRRFAGTSRPVRAEAPDPKVVVKFKDHIEERLRSEDRARDEKE